MSSNTDTKLDASDEQVASGEPKLAHQETELVTNPKGDESSESAAGQPATYTGMASNAAATAVTTAANMKDNVFSMFGGGAKKEKKEPADDDTNEPSGSSKAKKDAEDEDVSLALLVLRFVRYWRLSFGYRIQKQMLLTFTSSRWCI